MIHYADYAQSYKTLCIAIYLSALPIQLITGVSNSVGVALAEGLKTDTIPSKNRFREVTGRDPIPLQYILKQLAEEMRKKTK